jgi:hypothetical protein
VRCRSQRDSEFAMHTVEYGLIDDILEQRESLPNA